MKTMPEDNRKIRTTEQEPIENKEPELMVGGKKVEPVESWELNNDSTFLDDLDRLGTRGLTFVLKSNDGQTVELEVFDYRITSGTLHPGELMSLEHILVTPEGLIKVIKEYFSEVSREERMEFIRKLGEEE